MSWTRTLFVAEGRIQPAGFDELVAGVYTQHRQRLLLSEAFQLAHRAGAEPLRVSTVPIADGQRSTWHLLATASLSVL